MKYAAATIEAAKFIAANPMCTSRMIREHLDQIMDVTKRKTKPRSGWTHIVSRTSRNNLMLDLSTMRKWTDEDGWVEIPPYTEEAIAEIVRTCCDKLWIRLPGKPTRYLITNVGRRVAQKTPRRPCKRDYRLRSGR